METPGSSTRNGAGFGAGSGTEGALDPVWDPARETVREDFGRAGASESALSERRPETPRFAEVQFMVRSELPGSRDRNSRCGSRGDADRLIEVGDDVVDVLDADRDSDQLGGHATRDLILSRELLVSG